MKTLLVLATLVAAACALRISEEEVKKSWNEFKTTHGKTYESEAEEEFRMKIFKENLHQITKHNERFARGEVTFDMGTNKYSDMLHHERVEMLNGYRRNPNKSNNSVHQPLEFPWPWHKTVDWRKKGYVTPVKDQGTCGGCWAFSVTGALEGQLFKKNHKLVSLSEQQLIDCSTENSGCNGGNQEPTFQYIKDAGGIDTEESYPFIEQDGTCAFKPSNVAGTDTGYVTIKSGSESDQLDAVKRIGPIAVSMDASWTSFDHYKSGVYYEPKCSSTDLDHAVLAVGYGREKGQDYWLVKNSWGTTWGEEGYVKIARNRDNHCGIATDSSYPTV